MLRLPQVTLFAIDCFTPHLTIAAMEYSTQRVRFGAALLLTDTKKFSFPRMPWLTIIHHEESDRMVPRVEAKYHPPLPIEYELAVMREPSKYVETSHFIHMEWDSAVVNHAAWDDAWLKYDYIGAPWPTHHEPGWPPCDETNNVGNGGFSLKSLRFAKLIREATDLFKDDPGICSSDMWPCRTMRPWLEKRKIKFAPESVAETFSCENRIYSGQFGMHGKWTCQMNGWGGDFFGKIRPKANE